MGIRSIYKFIIASATLPLLGLTLCSSAFARPVSYPDGWTVMLRNDAFQNSAHIHYTTDMRHSIGLRLIYDREEDFIFTGAQVNRLMKRWNKPDSQANIYARFAAGQVRDDLDSGEQRLGRGDDIGILLGLSADWETRRYFISAEAEHWDNGQFGEASTLHGRVGIAPYIANTGALHTWLMIEGHNRPESEEPLGASALVRFFKGPSLLELGVDNDGAPLINYIHRF